MGEYARVDNGVVMERAQFDSIEGRFHPDIAAQWHDCPAEVEEGWLFDGVAFSAPPYSGPTLDDLKAEKNVQINRWRYEANFATFPFAGKQIACDALSRSDIDGINGYVADRGTLPPDFPGAWKATDNTWIPVSDVATWRELYDAMVAQGAANFAHSQDLKAQVAAATTEAELDAIVW